MRPLTDAIGRLARAERHLKELKDIDAEFRGSDPYGHRIRVHRHKTVTGRVDAAEFHGTFSDLRIPDAVVVDLGDGRLEVRLETIQEFGIALDVRRPLATTSVGAIVGDIVHNLRSVLEYVTWELSEHYSGPAPPDPIPRSDRWRDIGLPVVQRSDQWKGAVRTKLWAVDPNLVTLFERLQPFRTHPKRPERHWLAVLTELSNRDKHRNINVVNSLVALDRWNPADWDWVKPEHGESPPKLRASVVKRRRLGPAQDGAELVRVKVLSSGGTNLAGLQDAMDMNLRFDYDMAFEPGPPAYGARVIPTLEAAHNRVTAALIEFSEAIE